MANPEIFIITAGKREAEINPVFQEGRSFVVMPVAEIPKLKDLLAGVAGKFSELDGICDNIITLARTAEGKLGKGIVSTPAAPVKPAKPPLSSTDIIINTETYDKIVKELKSNPSGLGIGDIASRVGSDKKTVADLLLVGRGRGEIITEGERRGMKYMAGEAKPVDIASEAAAPGQANDIENRPDANENNEPLDEDEDGQEETEEDDEDTSEDGDEDITEDGLDEDSPSSEEEISDILNGDAKGHNW